MRLRENAMPHDVGAIGLTSRGSNEDDEGDGVNRRGLWVRTEIVWLPTLDAIRTLAA